MSKFRSIVEIRVFDGTSVFISSILYDKEEEGRKVVLCRKGKIKKNSHTLQAKMLCIFLQTTALLCREGFLFLPCNN
jgi:hypothetical protein